MSQARSTPEAGSSLAQVQTLSDVPDVPDVVVTNEGADEMIETTPLLHEGRLPSYNTAVRDPESSQQNQIHPQGTWDRILHQFPTPKVTGPKLHGIMSSPKSWDLRQIAHKVLVEPVSMLPAVFLGLLLNLLDALSYGIILFPLGEDTFKDLGPDGVSMFYVSCIVSQLVYSTGSIFKGGVGSEMIEVVPFFHKMVRMTPDGPRRADLLTSLCSTLIDVLNYGENGNIRPGSSSSDCHYLLRHELDNDWTGVLRTGCCALRCAGQLLSTFDIDWLHRRRWYISFRYW